MTALPGHDHMITILNNEKFVSLLIILLYTGINVLSTYLGTNVGTG